MWNVFVVGLPANSITGRSRGLIATDYPESLSHTAIDARADAGHSATKTHSAAHAALNAKDSVAGASAPNGQQPDGSAKQHRPVAGQLVHAAAAYLQQSAICARPTSATQAQSIW